jgi:hypothetical protein
MNRPRKPTHFEMAEYLDYWMSQDDEGNWDNISASEEVERDLVAVFDQWYHPNLRYNGKVMLRMSNLTVRAYVWKDGLVMSIEDYISLSE